MVRIEEVGGNRLPPIPEESSGSTRTQTKDYDEVFLSFPPGFRGGMILNISADEPTVDGKTEQDRDARVARNTHRHERRARTDAAQDAGGRHHVHRDLSNTFDMCGNHQVHRTPTANIAVVMNELSKLPPSPVVEYMEAHLKAATVQVNENLLGAHTSTISISSSHNHRPRASRRG
jgi:hypothetical protein